MKKTINILLIICGALIIASAVLMATNMKLYCKIALLNPIGSVPTICLKEAIKDLK